MRSKVVGHILPKDFYLSTERKLIGLGASGIDYEYSRRGIENLLSLTELSHGDNPEKKLTLANHQIPQKALEVAHDELLNILDQRLFFSAHLIKIHNFLPYLINYFGPEYTHEKYANSETEKSTHNSDGNVLYGYDFKNAAKFHDASSDEPIAFAKIDLNHYLDINNLYQFQCQIIESTFNYLYQLRDLMLPNTLQNRQKDPQRDTFCRLFLDNDEIHPHQIHCRMEFDYLIRSGFPLGLFPTMPSLSKWMAKQRHQEAFSRPLFQSLKKGTLSMLFPGVGLKNNDKTCYDNVTKRDIARNLMGIIPEHGIYIGENDKKQTRTKPRLIYQSPR